MFQTRNGNQELILVANWFPLVQFLGIVSPLVYRPRLSVLTLAL